MAHVTFLLLVLTIGHLCPVSGQPDKTTLAMSTDRESTMDIENTTMMQMEVTKPDGIINADKTEHGNRNNSEETISNGTNIDKVKSNTDKDNTYKNKVTGSDDVQEYNDVVNGDVDEVTGNDNVVNITDGLIKDLKVTEKYTITTESIKIYFGKKIKNQYYVDENNIRTTANYDYVSNNDVNNDSNDNSVKNNDFGFTGNDLNAKNTDLDKEKKAKAMTINDRDLKGNDSDVINNKMGVKTNDIGVENNDMYVIIDKGGNNQSILNETGATNKSVAKTGNDKDGNINTDVKYNDVDINSTGIDAANNDKEGKNNNKEKGNMTNVKEMKKTSKAADTNVKEAPYTGIPSDNTVGLLNHSLQTGLGNQTDTGTNRSTLSNPSLANQEGLRTMQRTTSTKASETLNKQQLTDKPTNPSLTSLIDATNQSLSSSNQTDIANATFQPYQYEKSLSYPDNNYTSPYHQAEPDLYLAHNKSSSYLTDSLVGGSISASSTPSEALYPYRITSEDTNTYLNNSLLSSNYKQKRLENGTTQDDFDLDLSVQVRAKNDSVEGEMKIDNNIDLNSSLAQLQQPNDVTQSLDDITKSHEDVINNEIEDGVTISFTYFNNIQDYTDTSSSEKKSSLQYENSFQNVTNEPNDPYLNGTRIPSRLNANNDSDGLPNFQLNTSVLDKVHSHGLYTTVGEPTDRDVLNKPKVDHPMVFKPQPHVTTYKRAYPPHAIHGLIWEDRRYMASVLVPVGCGIAGALVIVCIAYAARSCQIRSNKKEPVIPQLTAADLAYMDRIMLLADSSDEDV